MQEQSSEIQVKSKRLRELLNNRNSIAKSTTPNRSEINQSNFNETNQENEDLLSQNINNQPKYENPKSNLLDDLTQLSSPKSGEGPISQVVQQRNESKYNQKDISQLKEKVSNDTSNFMTVFSDSNAFFGSDQNSRENIDSFLKNEKIAQEANDVIKPTPLKISSERESPVTLGKTSDLGLEFAQAQETKQHMTKAQAQTDNSAREINLIEKPEKLIARPIDLATSQEYFHTDSKTKPNSQPQTPTMSLNPAYNKNSLNSQKNEVLSSPRDKLPSRVIEEQCRFHPNNSILYICLKNSCGELLCPLCLYEHQKIKHIGEYEEVSSYCEKLGIRLNDVHEKLVQSIDKLVGLQAIVSESDKFDLKLCFELERIEESLIKNIKQFFSNLREEFKNDVFFDYKKIMEDLNSLHQKTNFTIQTLEEDLAYFSQAGTNISAQFISEVIQKNYIDNSFEFQKRLNTIDQRIRHFYNQNIEDKPEQGLWLETSSNLKAKLLLLLNEGVKINKIPKQSKKSPLLESEKLNRGHKRKETNEDLLNYYKELANTLEDGRELKSTLPKNLEPIEELIESPPRNRGRFASADYHSSRARAKTFSPLRDSARNNLSSIRGGTTNRKDSSYNSITDIYRSMRPHTISPSEKDLDVYAMRFLIQYLQQQYNSPKVRIFDHEFFQRLFGVSGDFEISDLDIDRMNFEEVTEFLEVQSTKHKCIFTAHERIFFVLHMQSYWLLAEIRTNPKMIILYDYIGKLTKERIVDQLYAILFEIIRYEYRTKLNLNPENFSWEKRLSQHPALVVKNTNDTGILALKIMSNAFQNKDFTSYRVSFNEINLVRKKVEKIFKVDDYKTSGKFVVI